MLVTFSCRAYADITMFGDIAVQLLKLMGHSGTVPGALLSEDVQPALERLEAGIARHAQMPDPQASRGRDDGEPAVSLAHRALPLIELLRAASKDGCNVMWDKT